MSDKPAACPECRYQDIIEDHCVYRIGPRFLDYDVTTLYCPNCDWLTFADWRRQDDDEAHREP